MPVESTRSQNVTVTCRRSPAASRGGSAIDELTDGDTGKGTGATGDAAAASTSERKPAIASSNLRRSPTRTTPRSFKSSVAIALSLRFPLGRRIKAVRDQV
jgi:hypothetical protein